MPTLVKFEGSSLGITIIEERTDYAVNERTGERMAVPFYHATSAGIGDFAIGDDVEVTDEKGNVVGTRFVQRTDPKTGELLYDMDAYRARWSEIMEPVVGKDHAPVIAGLAFVTAQVEEKRKAVVAMAEAARAEREAMAADIDARQKAALQVIVDKHDEVVRAVAVEKAALDAQRADFEAAVADAQDILKRASTVIDAQAVDVAAARTTDQSISETK